MLKVFLNSLSNALVKVFHPVFLFSWFFVYYLNAIGKEADIYTYLKVVGLSAVLPVAFAALVVKDLHLVQHKNRLLAIAITVFFNVLILLDGYLNHTFIINNLFIITCLMSVIICQVLLFILTFMDLKASIHAAGVGGMLPFVSVIFISKSSDLKTIILQISILLLGGFLIIRQRYVSHSHTILELLAGFMVGLITSGMMLYFLYTLTKAGA